MPRPSSSPGRFLRHVPEDRVSAGTQRAGLYPDKASHSAYSSDDFQNIGLEETLARLKGVAAIDLTAAARDSLKRLAKERNKLQHFGLEDQVIAIESLTGEVLDALLRFVVEHLRPGADQDELEALDQTQDLIREELERIDTLVKAPK